MTQVFGPYSPVRKAGSTYYVSGQVGVDGQTKQAEADVYAQTMKAFENMAAVLQTYDLEMDDVCKVTIFLTDMDNFSIVNECYEKVFAAPRPARSTVGVADLPHVGNEPLLVEREAIAYSEGGLASE